MHFLVPENKERQLLTQNQHKERKRKKERLKEEQKHQARSATCASPKEHEVSAKVKGKRGVSRF